VVDAEDHVPERDRVEAQRRGHPGDRPRDGAPGDLERAADAARGAAEREDRKRERKSDQRRQRNPFLEHKLSSIALNHEAKVRTRLAPTLADYRDKFGRNPQRLSGLI